MRARAAWSLSVGLAVFVCAPAVAQAKSIKGELSRDGYTVVALGSDGEGDTAEARPRFKLRPPDDRVSLHLQDPDGFYVGPIVVATRKNGRVAIVGVRHGASLGEVDLSARKGYATSNSLAKRFIDQNRDARAKRGVPIGAGNLGLVRSNPPRRPPPGDVDADGVADPLDIDANGNLIIDRYEGIEANAARGGTTLRQAERSTVFATVLAVNQDGSIFMEECETESRVTVEWPAGSPTPEVGKVYRGVVEFTPGGINVISITGPIEEGCPVVVFVPDVGAGLSTTLRATLNAHTHAGDPAAFESLVEQNLQDRGILLVGGGSNARRTVELDCYGAPFCTAGGTGRHITDYFTHTPQRSWPLFPECCDADGDGFGEIGGGFISHGASTDQIGAGTGLNWRITANGEEHEFPTSLAGVIATVPALTSYEDGAGNRGEITYPVQPPYVGSPRDFFGPFEGPYVGLPVAGCPAAGPPPCVDEGDRVVRFTFFRPQREALEGEPGQWTDIRGLVYSVGLATGFPAANTCQQARLAETDPNLSEHPSPGSGIFAGGGFLDSGEDTDATLSFGVNMTKCLADQGQPQGSDVTAWLSAGVRGADGSAGATQQLLFDPY